MTSVLNPDGAGADQPHICLMNQGGRLQLTTFALASHLPGGDAMKFVVDETHGLFTGVPIPILHAIQQLGEAAGGRVVRCGHGCLSINPQKHGNEVWAAQMNTFAAFLR